MPMRVGHAEPPTVSFSKSNSISTTGSADHPSIMTGLDRHDLRRLVLHHALRRRISM